MNLEQQKHFETRLDALEEQMLKLKTSARDTDSVKVGQTMNELPFTVPTAC